MLKFLLETYTHRVFFKYKTLFQLYFTSVDLALLQFSDIILFLINQRESCPSQPCLY